MVDLVSVRLINIIAMIGEMHVLFEYVNLLIFALMWLFPLVVWCGAYSEFLMLSICVSAYIHVLRLLWPLAVWALPEAYMYLSEIPHMACRNT